MEVNDELHNQAAFILIMLSCLLPIWCRKAVFECRDVLEWYKWEGESILGSRYYVQPQLADT